MSSSDSTDSTDSTDSFDTSKYLVFHVYYKHGESKLIMYDSEEELREDLVEIIQKFDDRYEYDSSTDIGEVIEYLFDKQDGSEWTVKNIVKVGGVSKTFVF